MKKIIYKEETGLDIVVYKHKRDKKATLTIWQRTRIEGHKLTMEEITHMRDALSDFIEKQQKLITNKASNNNEVNSIKMSRPITCRYAEESK